MRPWRDDINAKVSVDGEKLSRPNSFGRARWMIPCQDQGLDPSPQAGTPRLPYDLPGGRSVRRVCRLKRLTDTAVC